MFEIFRRISFPHLFVFTVALFPILARIGIPVNSTFVFFAYSYTIVFYLLWYKRNYFRPANPQDYRIITIYLVWTTICIIRGFFVAENYWEYKNIFWGTLCLILPLFSYLFANPYALQKTLKLWLKYIFPLFILVLSWLIHIDGYHFYISPILFLGCFLPILPKKWRIVFILFLLTMIAGELGARAQMLKAAATLSIAIGLHYRRLIPIRLLKIVHWMFYVLPIVLLILGITGIFNIFKDNSEKYQGKYVETKLVNGEKQIVDASADTRTFIYEEVITSAVRHNYVLWGRTPARGNDSMTFGKFSAEELKTGKYERYMNEVCHPNVFTWLGLLGMIPWCLIYLRSSYLAIYKSNNIYIKYLGVFIAFRFFLGWIEDMNNFNISGITVWMMIAIGLSYKFRSMDNITFKRWLWACFPFK